MSRQTILFLGLGAVTYYFLSTRQPVYAKLADGTFAPAGILDRITVALTGAIPPTPQPTYSVNAGGYDLTYGPGGISLQAPA
jgi:hypothetical protein